MIKKLLHRITVVWCLYGLVRFCIFLNPWIFRVVAMVKPFYYESSVDPKFNDVWDSGSLEQILFVWFFTAIAIGVIVGGCAAIHHFSNWFFNTANENEEE